MPLTRLQTHEATDWQRIFPSHIAYQQGFRRYSVRPLLSEWSRWIQWRNFKEFPEKYMRYSSAYWIFAWRFSRMFPYMKSQIGYWIIAPNRTESVSMGWQKSKCVGKSKTAGLLFRQIIRHCANATAFFPRYKIICLQHVSGYFETLKQLIAFWMQPQTSILLFQKNYEPYETT